MIDTVYVTVYVTVSVDVAAPADMPDDFLARLVCGAVAATWSESVHDLAESGVDLLACEWDAEVEE